MLEVGGVPVAIVEAKRTRRSAADGIGQAKVYAQLLDIPLAYASNGKVTVRIDTANGKEDYNVPFPTPAEAWEHFQIAKGLSDRTVQAYIEPFNRELRLSNGKVKEPRYYQRTAVDRTVERVLAGDRRLLVVMATGTGKSFLAMQIAWKLQKTPFVAGRTPRILYLADRNLLVDQPRLREFVPVFGENAIHKFAGTMKTGRDIYFGLYQNLGAGQENWYREYPADYFDAIVVDECHRGTSTTDSTWRQLLEYFEPAAQIGLTATPVVHEGADTYRHFGDPIFEYSLAQGIEDGFLAPYAVRRVVLSADAFGYSPGDGELDLFGNETPDGLYESPQFERVVAMLSRTETAARHLSDYLKSHDRHAKTIIFCVNSDHADAMRRAMHNENSDITAEDPDYVVRIVSAEYESDRLLANFSDPERQSPRSPRPPSFCRPASTFPRCATSCCSGRSVRWLCSSRSSAAARGSTRTPTSGSSKSSTTAVPPGCSRTRSSIARRWWKPRRRSTARERWSNRRTPSTNPPSTWPRTSSTKRASTTRTR